MRRAGTHIVLATAVSTLLIDASWMPRAGVEAWAPREPAEVADHDDPGGGAPAPPPLPIARLRFQNDPDEEEFGTVVVTGLDPRALARLEDASPDAALWSRLLPVFTGESLPADGSHPPILGAWSIEAGALRFSPRFTLATGLRFFARFDGALFDAVTGATEAGTPVLDLAFAMPDPGIEPFTHVTAVYPSGEIVPENLLRLYLHFSAPMRDQPVQGMVRLFDDQGSEVETAFVDVRRGLWDPGHRRLTLIFHPGRIKRGVGPHEVMGPPLREGSSFRLVVSAGLVDAQGFPLEESFEKTYRVGAADRTSPDPDEWTLIPPYEPGSPLAIDLPEAMDHALMLRLVTVEDGRGELVRGAAALSSGETRWTFTPESPWRPGRYSVVVVADLEDLAGNTASRLFDEEAHARRGPRAAGDPAPVRLRFRVGPDG